MNRKPRSAQFKSQVALEALKNQKTANELASEYEVHPNQIGQWRKQLLEGLPSLFANGRAKGVQNDETLQARLYEEIGRLKVELDWLKKKLPHSVETKRRLTPAYAGVRDIRTSACAGNASWLGFPGPAITTSRPRKARKTCC